LQLNGLTTLSQDAAEARAEHEGELELIGLESLSLEAENALLANSEMSIPHSLLPELI